MTTVLITCQAGAAYAPPIGTEPKDAEVPVATVTQGEGTPEVAPNKPSFPKIEPEQESMPPNLEAFVPGECLPDNLDVCVTSTSYRILVPGQDHSSWKRFTQQHPVRFVREYPPRTPTDAGNESKPQVAPDTTGQLDLRCSNFLGDGHHSHVVLAPLTLPSTGPSIHGAVAVKLSGSASEQREMLLNEAKIYNAFPRELQEGTSYAPPVVPKFYGYYVPSLEAFDSHADDEKISKEERKRIRKVLMNHTPILLMEACGKQICAENLHPFNREQIVMLMHRLHAAGFTQGSFYERNILVQPGPLTLPSPERFLSNPSYRIIDFGRGKSPNVNFESIEDWTTEAEDERGYARREMRYSYRTQ